MIKINKLLENWTKNEYGIEEIREEYKRLNNAIWALYENGMITNETLVTSNSKLNIALNIMETRFAEE